MYSVKSIFCSAAALFFLSCNSQTNKTWTGKFVYTYSGGINVYEFKGKKK